MKTSFLIVGLVILSSILPESPTVRAEVATDGEYRQRIAPVVPVPTGAR